MEERYQDYPSEVRGIKTGELQHTFIAADLMQPGKIDFVYTDNGRIMIGGIRPGAEPIILLNYDQLKSDFFLVQARNGCHHYCK